MKKFSKNLIALASASILAGTAMASGLTSAKAVAPNAATVKAVQHFVASYSGAGVRLAMDTVNTGVQNLALYPTADKSVVFVSFQTNGTNRPLEHVALVETKGGAVTRFTDFSGNAPKDVKTAAANKGAQGQARTFLAPELTTGTVHTQIASTKERHTAQDQAADLLRSTTPVSQDHHSARMASTESIAHGDSQSMVRALLTFSSAE